MKTHTWTHGAFSLTSLNVIFSRRLGTKGSVVSFYSILYGVFGTRAYCVQSFWERCFVLFMLNQFKNFLVLQNIVYVRIAIRSFSHLCNSLYLYPIFPLLSICKCSKCFLRFCISLDIYSLVPRDMLVPYSVAVDLTKGLGVSQYLINIFISHLLLIEC